MVLERKGEYGEREDKKRECFHKEGTVDPFK